MKTLHSILGLLIFGLSVAPLAQAQDDNAKAQALVEQAVQDFDSNKYDNALAKLQEANKLKPSTPYILNLLGAAYTKKKDYTAAKEQFDLALALDYQFFPAQFNLGEIFFLQKQYAQALEHFTKMSRNYPYNELLQFKIVLCLLLTDHVDEAKKMFARMKFPGAEPAWYYAKAAIAYKEGNKGEARDNISAADLMYSGKTSLYSETFQDLDWPTK